MSDQAEELNAALERLIRIGIVNEDENGEIGMSEVKKERELTPEIEKMIKDATKGMFMDMIGDPEYPFKTIDEQEIEYKQGWKDGWLSEKYLRFCTGNEH